MGQQKCDCKQCILNKKTGKDYTIEIGTCANCGENSEIIHEYKGNCAVLISEKCDCGYIWQRN